MKRREGRLRGWVSHSVSRGRSERLLSGVCARVVAPLRVLKERGVAVGKVRQLYPVAPQCVLYVITLE